MSSLASAWHDLSVGLEASSVRAMGEFDRACTMAFQLARGQRGAAGRYREIPAASLESWPQVRNEASQELCRATIERWVQDNPLEAAQRAASDYHRAVDDLVSRLPQRVVADSTEILAVAGDGAKGLRAALVRLRRGQMELPLRPAIAGELASSEPAMRAAEGRLFASLARVAQLLVAEWASVRDHIDTGVGGSKTGGDAVRRDARNAGDPMERAEAESARALAELKALSEARETNLRRRLVTATRWPWRRRARVAPMRRKHVEHWAEQGTALAAELALELALDDMERASLDAVLAAAGSLTSERTRLRGQADELADVVSQLRPAGESLGHVPDGAASVVPAAARLRNLMETGRAIIDRLPDTVAVLRHPEPTPRRWARGLRRLRPRRVAHRALDVHGAPRFEAILADVERAHLGVVQQVERVRHVIGFAVDEARRGATLVAEEAVANARTLLDALPAEHPDLDSSVRAVLISALATVLVENRRLVVVNRVMREARLRGLDARRGFGVMTVAAAGLVLVSGRFLLRASLHLVRRFLVSIGWRAAVGTVRATVVRRPYLPLEYTIDTAQQSLPATYRRLFRFDAVSDARFLVGRGRELQAVAEARELWQLGRPVAIVVVGERGSGKTSLINCALGGPLSDLPVVRGELKERTTTAAEFHVALRSLLGLSSSGDVEAALLATRRIVVLEEAERAFRRHIGGFGAMRELQRLVAATSATTLWVVVLNQSAFRLLDAAVGLGGSFSHRLDAASASGEAIREAIMLRHNLSGLQLRFEGRLPRRGVRERVRRRLLGAEDPEQAFFSELTREANGVFRSAFQLWLGQVADVQAGMLTIKPIEPPRLDDVIGLLDRDDLFTLVGILQHGSLNAADHAAVFGGSPATGQRRLDELLAAELIEADPGREGYRVRPRALRLVNEALRRHNLG